MRRSPNLGRRGDEKRKPQPVPISTLSARRVAASRRALRRLALISPSRWLRPPARTTESGRVEIGQTQEGNYLSALVASADRDTNAAALYFREALRADPRNVDLIERAFASALADGDAPTASRSPIV